MGVSSHSVKDKTMLCRNGVDVKPFGTSCPAHFPLNSGWEDVLKMFSSCVCHGILQMMARNEDSCRLFQIERILRKNALFPLVPSPGRNDRMWNRFSLRKRCDALISEWL